MSKNNITSPYSPFRTTYHFKLKTNVALPEPKTSLS